ncbi:MAG: hypothetical protein NVSMB1_25080 [Polyangiales bacterium]
MSLSEIPSSPRPSQSQQANRPSGNALRIFLGAHLPFIVGAFWALIVVRLVWRNPRYLVPLALSALLWATVILIQRSRKRAMLLRGNVPEVIEAFSPMLARLPFAKTMQPLLIATAYASNGWTDAARETLRRAERGEAWDASKEQRLVIDTLLESFDGDRGRAVALATELNALALPPVGIFLRRRVSALRAGVLSLARAFHRESQASDRAVLLNAAKATPLLHWSFSYAAAVVAVDEGDPSQARLALRGAPSWSDSSRFAAFHVEIMNEIERLERGQHAPLGAA